MDGWDQLAADGDPRTIAARIIEECATFDLAALRNDPFSTLVRSTEITVTIEDGMGNTGCGGGAWVIVRGNDLRRCRRRRRRCWCWRGDVRGGDGLCGGSLGVPDVISMRSKA